MRYIGADVVDILVEENRRRFSDDMRTFLTLDLTKNPLPKADIILSRLLVSSVFKDISRAIANIQASGAQFYPHDNKPIAREQRRYRYRRVEKTKPSGFSLFIPEANPAHQRRPGW